MIINEYQRACDALNKRQQSAVDWEDSNITAKAAELADLVKFSADEIISMAKLKASMHSVNGTKAIIDWLDKRIADEQRKSKKLVRCHA